MWDGKKKSGARRQAKTGGTLGGENRWIKEKKRRFHNEVSKKGHNGERERKAKTELIHPSRAEVFVTTKTSWDGGLIVIVTVIVSQLRE